MGKRFLLMAKAEKGKILAGSENASEWVKFSDPDVFAPGGPLFISDAVYAVISQNAWTNKDKQPGFAIVDEGRLPEAGRARRIVVLGNVEVLGKVAARRAERLPELEESEEEPTAETFIPVVTTPDAERLACPLCKGKFNDEVSLQDHMEFHL